MDFRTSKLNPVVVLALLVTWLVWGSSFVAISWALEALPPLLMMASRFIVAGALATVVGLLLSRRAGRDLPCARAWRDSTLIGIGFVTIGMGATGWSATRLPTGVAALLVASAPLWIALLQALFQRERTSSLVGLAGLAVGIVGVGILVAPGGGGDPIDLVAAAVLVASNAAWAAASLFAPRATAPGGLVLGVGMQMLTGGALLLAVAVGLGEGGRLDLGAIGAASAGGWIYLVLAASIGGFLAYGWLLENVSAGTAATHAFINPLVAVALGALLLGEQVGGRMLVAGGAVVIAVVLLLVGEARVTAAALGGSPKQPVRPRRSAMPSSAYGARRVRTYAIGRGRSTGTGWAPTPTPAFAARRTARPWQATDGMDALAIDEAFDRII